MRISIVTTITIMMMIIMTFYDKAGPLTMLSAKDQFRRKRITLSVLTIGRRPLKPVSSKIGAYTSVKAMLCSPGRSGGARAYVAIVEESGKQGLGTPSNVVSVGWASPKLSTADWIRCVCDSVGRISAEKKPFCHRP